MSWFKKLAWLYGEQIPPDFPDDLPVYKLLEMSEGSRFPFRLANTDEVSVILEPHGDQAKLVCVSPYQDGPISIEKIDLEEPLFSAQELANNIAQRATKLIIVTQNA